MLKRESLQPRRISVQDLEIAKPTIEDVRLSSSDEAYEARREELQEAEHASDTALGRRALEGLTESAKKGALQGAKRNLVSAGVASYLGAPTDIVSDLALNPSSFVEAASSGIIGSLPSVATKAAGVTGKWATAGSLLGQVSNFIAPGSGVVTSVLGRVLGDILGDALNMREFEGMRDYFEDTYGPLEGRARAADWMDAGKYAENVFESLEKDLDEEDFSGWDEGSIAGDGGSYDADVSGPDHVGEGGTTAYGM